MEDLIFQDNSRVVIQAIEDTAIAFLHEAKASIASQTSMNCRVNTTALQQSFQNDSTVDEKKLCAYVGSNLQYAIYEELGTGEYALEGNGRKGGWAYFDDTEGKWYFTRGNQPQRMLHNAYMRKKTAIQNRARQMFGG